MKKIIRILGISLVLVLASCTPQETEIDTTPEVTPQSISGEYTYNVVLVANGVDIDGDGKTNTNLMNEKGKECVWDNTWVFTESKVTFYEKGSKCEVNSPDIILTAKYEYDKNKGTITIIDEAGKIVDVLNDVLLEYEDYSKQTNLSFSTFEKDLNQSVRYVLKR
jgi:hypothetical protein